MKTSAETPTIAVHVPLTFAPRGGRKTVISEAGPTSANARIDSALLKALARAHRWRQKIENGEYTSITELAKVEGLNQSYACRLMRLTLLAPAIVMMVIDSRADSNVTLKDLLKPLPVRWDEQIASLNIAEGA